MSRLLFLLLLPVLVRLLRVKRLPSRELTVRPTEERVILLGSSSGVGKDLAFRYAKRGARM